MNKVMFLIGLMLLSVSVLAVEEVLHTDDELIVFNRIISIEGHEYLLGECTLVYTIEDNNDV